MTFDFPADWTVSKYDGWSFYRNQFQNVCGGAKAVDFVAVDSDKGLWLIEVKDYRQHARTNTRHSRLFPRAIDPAAVQTKIRQSIRAVDPHPRVVEISSNRAAWTVARRSSS